MSACVELVEGPCQEGIAIRRAERDAKVLAEREAAHASAIREDRNRRRRATLQRTLAEKRRLQEMTLEADRLAHSASVGDRLMARELVAAAAQRRTDLTRLSAQRLRNAAFNGVRHASVR